MATPVFSPSSFITGEVAPALFGHTDLARFHSGAATMRNMWPRITGGAYSRAGTKYVGFSRQTTRPYPPRLLPFQFSIRQGRILEFGNFYMRVIADAGFITDISLEAYAATNTNPLTVTIPNTGGTTATPLNFSVYSSYVPGEVVTVAGGAATIPAEVEVLATQLLSIVPVAGVGSGYAPGDSIVLSGGTQVTPPVVLVGATQVNAAIVAGGGSGGTDGIATVTGTTGSGLLFSAQVQIIGGAIVNVIKITTPGAYTANPAAIAAEPVTGGGVVGATLSLLMGPQSVTLTSAGVFIADPGNAMGQAATSGAGVGAQFVSPLLGVQSAAVVNGGAYTSFPVNPVSQASSTGSGLGVEFNMTWGAGALFNVGDWISFAGVGGMTELNGQTLVVAQASGNVYSFYTPCGYSVDATAWGRFSSAGVASRIMTVPSPYSEQDLKWLKFTQSADVMSICCVNQDDKVEYPPYDLQRLSDTNWVFNPVTFLPTVAPPGWCNISGSYNYAFQSLSDFKDYPNPVCSSYAYCVTAINPKDGTESIASPVGSALGIVDISNVAGSIRVNYASVPGVQNYNIYKAAPVSAWGFYPGPVPIGALFGFAGTALGASWTDNNVTPDFAQTPPTHQNPFARGAITAVNATAGGNGYHYGATVAVNTSTGSGAVIVPVIQNSGYAGQVDPTLDLQVYYSGPIVGYLVLDGGQNYRPTDTISITDASHVLGFFGPGSPGGGHGAEAAIVTAPLTGTYPSLVAYFQQRRIYASTLNDPDTYWMSVVGAYSNFDTRIPTIDSDAIEGTPWTQQVNGIQWMIPMPGGIVTLTGLGAWNLGGDGSSPLNPQPITPASQQAQPQAFSGASPTVPPVKIDWDVIFVQAIGASYRDFSLTNYFTNFYAGRDITVNSPHLFLTYGVVEHAWCEEPYKLLWSIRNDGALLSMTYYKPEQVLGWARHDTFGEFCSVASVKEPPVDAAYFAVLRPLCPNGGCACIIERMDNRLWKGVEDVWAVDCGLQYPQPQPQAILNISAPDGNGAVVGVTGFTGGQNYGPATFAYVVDQNGVGTGQGAAVAVTVAHGVVGVPAITAPGAGYTYPQLVIEDPSGQGTGAGGTLVLQTQAVFIANAAVFSVSSIGAVIRAAGGTATITQYVNPSEVIASFIVPASAFMPELGQGVYIPNVAAGQWSLTEPVAKVGGLWHLAGQTVTGLADGAVVTPRTVSSKGEITLDQPATAVVIGLSFTAQLQSMYVDVGEPTVQGQRKKVAAVTARMDASRDFQIGANQVDGSTLSPIQLGPNWSNMEPAANLGVAPFAGGPLPLWTGDTRIPITGGVGKPGQVAMMQTNPLPMNCLALIPEAMAGDTAEQKATPRQRGPRGREAPQ